MSEPTRFSTVRAKPGLNGGIIIHRPDAQRLEHVQTQVLTVARAGGAGSERWTRTPPDTPNEHTAHLGPDGVISIGDRVTPGLVMVGKVIAFDAALASKVERQRRHEMGNKLLDRSLRAPPGCDGVVAGVERQQTSGGGETIAVTVESRAFAAIGDIVEDDTGRRLGVEGLQDVPDGQARMLRVLERAEDVLEARSIGPYSIVTNQPLGGKMQFGGQELGLGHLASLEANGAGWVIYEAMTSKSDDRAGRYRLYESIVLGEPQLAPTTPEATRRLERFILALGLDVGLEAARPTLRLSTPSAIRSLSSGPVTTRATLEDDGSTVPDGLFCEFLFGDSDSDERSERFAHIDLPCPVVHTYFRESVALLLDLSLDEVAGVQFGRQGRSLSEALEEVDLEALGERDDQAGALARQLLENRIEPRQLMLEVLPVLPPALRPIVKLDNNRWAVSDLNDLYLEVMYQADRVEEHEEDGDSRLAAQLDLQRAVDALMWNEGTDEPRTAEFGRPLKSLSSGFAFERMMGKRVDYSGRALVMPTDAVAETEVALPQSAAIELFRPFLYSELEAAGHVTTIKKAKAMAEEAGPIVLDLLERLLHTRTVLVCPAKASGRVPFAGLRPSLWAHSAIGLHPSMAQRLTVSWDVACLHVPLTQQALDEAAAVRARDEAPSRIESAVACGGTGWITRAALGTPAVVLAAAALASEEDPVTDPLTRLMLGRYPFGLDD